MDYKKRIYITTLVSITFTILINIFIYNYRVIVESILPIKVEPLKHYVARFCLYFLFTVIFFKKSDGVKIIWITFIPVFLLDSLTIFTGKSLIPLRFPFDTIYPLLGILSGFFLKDRIKFLIIFTFSIIFIVISDLYIRPFIIWQRREHNNEKYRNKNISLLDKKFLTINNTYIRLNDTLKTPAKLIELYFVGCAPCEEKYEVLKLLSNTYKKSDFQIVLICDGTISSYSSFISHAKKNKFEKIAFLFDDSKILSNNKWIEGYPTEILLSGEKIKNVDSGFGEPIKEKWFKKEKSLINEIINHEK